MSKFKKGDIVETSICAVGLDCNGCDFYGKTLVVTNVFKYHNGIEAHSVRVMSEHGELTDEYGCFVEHDLRPIMVCNLGDTVRIGSTRWIYVGSTEGIGHYFSRVDRVIITRIEKTMDGVFRSTWGYDLDD